MAAGETMHVYFVIAPNVLMLDYVGPAEALRMAAQMGGNIAVHTCGPQPRMTTSLGVALEGLAPLPKRLPPNSLVMVPGSADEENDYRLPAAQRIVGWLRDSAGAGARVASICSGALLLARAGLLAGRRCTTHYSLIDALQRDAPSATVESDCIFTEDGPVLTSAGITAGIDLALYIIEAHAGARLASAIARRQVVYLRRSGRDPQLSPWLAHRNHVHPAVHRAQDAIAADPARAWSLDALGEVAHVSARHLTRLFAEHAGTTVGAYHQRLRIARARELLTDANLAVERVAELAGFASARDFRRVWQRYETGSPAEVRAALLPANTAG